MLETQHHEVQDKQTSPKDYHPVLRIDQQTNLFKTENLLGFCLMLKKKLTLSLTRYLNNLEIFAQLLPIPLLRGKNIFQIHCLSLLGLKGHFSMSLDSLLHSLCKVEPLLYNSISQQSWCSPVRF